MLEMSRDLVEQLQFIPRPSPGGGHGSRALARSKHAAKVGAVMNEAIQGVKMLYSGLIDESILKEPFAVSGPGPPVTQRACAERELCLQLQARVESFLSLAPKVEAPRDAAFGRLLGMGDTTILGAAGRSASGFSKGTPIDKIPRRGDTWPLVVDAVALPENDIELVELAKISPSCGKFLNNIKSMLRTKEEVEEIEIPSRYSDPALDDKETKLALLRRMHRAKMLRGTATCAAFVSIFAVVKKVMPDGTVVLRLIFDERQCNRLWKRPPWVAMGGASALAWMDFSAVRNEPGRFRVHTGDVPDYYHHLLLPPDFWPYFVFEDVTMAEFAAYLERFGESCELEGEFLALAVTAMGWSWAVFLAQNCLRDRVTLNSELISADNMIVEGAPVPSLEVDQANIHSEFVDDFNVFGHEPGLAEEDEVEGPVRQAYMGGATGVHDAGLSLHKESYTSSAMVLVIYWDQNS